MKRPTIAILALVAVPRAAPLAPLTSHRAFPGPLGAYYRVKGLIPKNEALALGERARALPPTAWDSDRHVSYPTRDVPVAAVCEDFEEAVWERSIRPALARCYGLPEKALWLFDCFVAVYEAGSGADELEPHRDATLLSFNVLLSRESDFDGGATVFADVDDESRTDAGDACLHPGQLLHGARKTTRGTRVVVVGFVEIDDDARVDTEAMDAAGRDLGRCSQLQRIKRKARAPFRHLCTTSAIEKRRRRADANFAAAALRATPEGRCSVVCVSDAANILRECGVVVLRSVLDVDASAAGRAVSALDARLAADGPDGSTLVERSDRRYDLRLDGPGDDSGWRDLSARASEIAARVVAAATGSDEWAPTTTGVVVALPGAEAQLYHADGMEEYYNVFCPLVDVPRAMGPTEFALESHLSEHAVTMAPTLEWDNTFAKAAPSLRRGDLVVFGYSILHRGLPNTAEDARPVLYATLAPPGARDELNFSS